MSKTSWKVKEKYNSKNYKQFNFRVEKSIGEDFSKYCKENNISMNATVQKFMAEFIKK